MATDTTPMDLDSQRNCSTCKTRMSSLLHDSHLICVACRGRDCNLDNRCVECEGWSRGGLWMRGFRLFAARERWSLRLRLRASSAACL